MPQITHMPLDAAIQARRINMVSDSVLDQMNFLPYCVTLLDDTTKRKYMDMLEALEYEQKEQMWLNEERF